MEIAEAIVEECKTIESRRDFSVSYVKQGDICAAEGSPDEAKVWYERSLEIREEIVKESETMESHDDLVRIFYRLVSVEDDQNKQREY